MFMKGYKTLSTTKSLFVITVFVYLFIACNTLAQVNEDRGEERYMVTVIHLMTNPTFYDGKRVIVIGYAHIRFEDTALYMSKEYADMGICKGAVWLDIGQIRPYSDKHNNYCIVEGYFDAAYQGHFNLFAGAIKKISRFDIRIPN